MEHCKELKVADSEKEKKFNDNSIMENAVNYESGLIVGKVIACLVIVGAFSLFSLNESIGFTVSFVFAGISSLFYMFL